MTKQDAKLALDIFGTLKGVRIYRDFKSLERYAGREFQCFSHVEKLYGENNVEIDFDTKKIFIRE